MIICSCEQGGYCLAHDRVTAGKPDVKSNGGYCSKCNAVYDHPHDCSVGKQENVSVLYKEIWNAAIEAALEWLNEEADWQTWNDPKDAEKIRKLKK